MVGQIFEGIGDSLMAASNVITSFMDRKTLAQQNAAAIKQGQQVTDQIVLDAILGGGAEAADDRRTIQLLVIGSLVLITLGVVWFLVKGK